MAYAFIESLSARDTNAFFGCERIFMSLTTPTNAAPHAGQSFPVGNSADTQGFFDRRASGTYSAGRERRQFGSSHANLSAEGRELALAIDEYKVQNHRRYITCDEMLSVLSKLGYQKIQ